MEIIRPERFEPENGKELRKAIREAFVGEHNLVIADVVYERAPIAPDGEVGIIAQTRDPVSLYHDYSPFQPFQEAFATGELDRLVEDAKNRLLDQVTVEQEGRSYESDEEWAKAYIQSFEDRGDRTCDGSVLVRDSDAYRKCFDVRNQLENPMRANDFLRLRGWIMMYNLEVYEEANRLMEEEGKQVYEIRDRGIRYTKGVTGIASRMGEAMGSQLQMDAIKLGGFEAYMDLIEKHRIDR